MPEQQPTRQRPSVRWSRIQRRQLGERAPQLPIPWRRRLLPIGGRGHYYLHKSLAHLPLLPLGSQLKRNRTESVKGSTIIITTTFIIA